jgi:hypothetical protein
LDILRPEQEDSHANQASSSSLRDGAGNGAPGSDVGSWTYPPLPNGFKDDMRSSNVVEELVRTGRSGSRRDQPSEFIDSLKEAEAIAKYVGAAGDSFHDQV